MSSTRLLVIGCVRMFQPVHGYEVRRELISWNADQWGDVPKHSEVALPQDHHPVTGAPPAYCFE